ncbi:MAG: hypothetical protein AAGI70_08905 [Pseudomonadota bacterium]
MRWAAILSLMALPAMAEDLPPLLCGGVEPNWSVRIEGDRASFSEPGQDAIPYDIPHRVQAEGRSYPRALTLIGQRSTAVALVDQRQCLDGMADQPRPFALEFLTQRALEPILLTGCCRVLPE